MYEQKTDLFLIYSYVFYIEGKSMMTKFCFGCTISIFPQTHKQAEHH